MSKIEYRSNETSLDIGVMNQIMLQNNTETIKENILQSHLVLESTKDVCSSVTPYHIEGLK